MQTKTMLALTLVTAVLLSGCQSTTESMNSAYVTCSNSGMRPGSWEHERCTRNMYAENRRKSDQAATAVAVGVAAGAIGAIAISEASKDRKDRHRSDRDRDYWQRPGRDRDRDGWGRPRW